METVKQMKKVTATKITKTPADFNKMIFFNMIITLNEQKRLTPTETQTLIDSATIINKLYN